MTRVEKPAFSRAELELSVPGRFEKIAAAFPASIALTATGRRVTYEELNASANRIAHVVLDRLGAGAEPVALLFENGAPMVAAMLGVLKAGKAFVPGDPANPRSRVSRVIGHSQARLLLTGADHLDHARDVAGPRCDVIDIDTFVQCAPDSNPGENIPGDRPAAILYTSGSTGEPKGVVLDHTFLLHTARNLIEALDVAPDDAFPVFHTMSFSGSQYALFVPLCCGARACIFDVKSVGDSGLARSLAADGITVYYSVVTFFHEFASNLSPNDDLSAIRLVYLLGEPLPSATARLFRERFPADCVLVNSYGATEVSYATLNFVDFDRDLEGPTVPIGLPLPDKEALILGEDGAPVPRGELGEIVVRTRYRAKGYYRRRDLTDRVFLPNPEESAEGLYRTGDMGRRLPDGRFVHLGRTDFQAKIRGYRVEPGEVEKALNEHPGVGRCAVMAHDDAAGGNRLVAWYVPAGEPPTASALRRWLASRLPDYMIPSAFVALERLPVSAVGKLDRRALPEPPRSRPSLDNAFEQPQTPVEKALSAVWEEVLGIEGIGRQDDFLELGGHSLKAAQVLSRIAETFRTELSPADFFAAPTVAATAAAVTARMAETAAGDTIAFFRQLEDAAEGPR